MNAMLLLGDCRDTMQFCLGDDEVDSIVTDPPYELNFMGKKWDASGVAFDVETWRQAFRVLKPGGHLLAFGGTRTYHRMVCAIEDAGFEIRDTIMWVYGSGFPKSLDVSKAIDREAGAVRVLTRPGVAQRDGYGEDWDTGSSETRPRFDQPATPEAKTWQGWGTALKPAHEPICVARKPLAKGLTVAANVLKFGTCGLNISGCRIGTTVETWPTSRARPADGFPNALFTHKLAGQLETKTVKTGEAPAGRWPANLIHDGSDEVLALFPQSAGQLADAKTSGERKFGNVYSPMRYGGISADSDNEGAVGFRMKPGARRADLGSAARFFYQAKASRRDRNEGCESMPKKPLNWSSGTQNPGSFQSEGTDKSAHNSHPTVKPTDLMRYLCRLVTPPGGVVLDPFMGSGSTGKAAMLEGFRFIGIEQDEGHLAIARARIAAVKAAP